MASVKDIDALLPQTQCGECGFSGCLPYAEALAQGAASIDLCPPGGVKTMMALAEILDTDPEPYKKHAEEQTRPPAIAKIRESECIGCTKCIQACPVDAIIGASRLMHSVIKDECTGCGLCVDPCPVDCIDLVPQTEPTYNKKRAKARYQARQSRQLRQEHEKQTLYRQKRLLAKKKDDLELDKQEKKAYIQQALARVKAKKNE